MEKYSKHRKMVISTKSLILIGMLCFCCAKTISFSIAKQYSNLNACKNRSASEVS